MLIGGATTSKMHTAVKIDPAYDNPVVHVTDASRAVGVVQKLLSKSAREDFAVSVSEEYLRMAAKRRAGRVDRQRISIAEARERFRAGLDRLHTACAEFHRNPDLLGLPIGRVDRADRLAAILRDLGVARPVPGSVDDPDGWRGRALTLG